MKTESDPDGLIPSVKELYGPNVEAESAQKLFRDGMHRDARDCDR